MFPNIKNLISILLTASAASASAQKVYPALFFIKTDYRSAMSEVYFNALVLLYVHWDIKLDYNRIIQMYANRYPRRLVSI